MALKWGILSVGKISNEFAKSLLMFNKDEHEIKAVASRSLDRSQEFAKLYNIPNAYSSYEKLATDKNVDIVYIGTIHPHHYALSKLMLENGKHVLCEKPMTMNEKQTTDLIKTAKQKKLFLMEAIWSRCFPAYEELNKLINSGFIGEVKHVEVTFGRLLSYVERMNAKELGGGTILDLGVYNLQFQQFVFNGLTPVKVVGSGHLNQHGTDQSASIILTYEGGKTAVLTTNCTIELPNEALIVGTKGKLIVPTFWCPTKIITDEETLEFPLPTSQYTSTRPSGFTYEIREVGKCIKEGLFESPKVPHLQSIQLAKLMDQWLQDVGVVYDADSL